ncbi:MAG: PAS domain-containing sensor histidine kinase [Catenulisporales bacterium]|nr:PAS domain-containing sensor histidine kinase [Catenulisporales bacterium]
MREFGRRRRGLVAAAAVPPVLTAVLNTQTERLDLSSQVLIYLVAVVAIARLCGMLAALVSAIWASVLLDYYFISPVHTFRIAGANDVIALTAFVIVAITVASVVEYSGKAAAEAAQLEAADRMRTALLTAVSHDLRAPLAAARAAVDTLRDPQFDLAAADRAELLGAAHASLSRLSRLVEDLLDMSRLQSGALKPHLEPVAVAEVVPRAIDDVPAAAGRVNVTAVPARTPVALADGALLERVLANLIGNAAKHTASPIEISVERKEDRAQVEVRVIDHGPGIPAADRERVFRPFQRLGDRDNAAGVGLGLALARGLTEAMGGTLLPEDTPGGGLTMVVAVPAGPATEPLATEQPDTGQPAAEPQAAAPLEGPDR